MISMAAGGLCQRVPRLRCLHGLRKNFHQAQHLNGKWEDHFDKERCLPAVAPSFWKHTSRCGVGSSRHFLSAINTRLDSDLVQKRSEHKSPSSKLVDQGKPKRKLEAPAVEGFTRVFHKCRPDYASMTFDLTQRPPPIEWEDVSELLQNVACLERSMTPSEVSKSLVELSRMDPTKMPSIQSKEGFVMLLQNCVVNLPLFSDLQLLEALKSFVWLNIPVGHKLLGLFEIELIRRANQMTLHQLLLTADLWRCIRKRVPKFLRTLYDSVSLDVRQMGAPELVQLLYIIGEGRVRPEKLMEPVEQRLLHHLEELHAEEVGVVCLGLFKSQTSPSSRSAVTSIVDKAASSVKDMSDFAMVNVLKFLRFNFYYHRAWMEAMHVEVPRRAHRMSAQGLMHAVLSCSSMHYRNDNILVAVAERIPSALQTARCKDSAKLLWSFGTLGFPPALCPSFYPSMTEDLRQRKKEFQRFPHHLLSALLGLAFASQFPEDLIEFALSADFFKNVQKASRMELNKDLLTIDGVVALELPQWTGSRMNPELREETAELLWKYAQSDVCLKPEVLEAESMLQDLLGGEEFVSKKMILPHTRSIDLELHFDSMGRPIPINSASHSTTLCPENNSSKVTLNQLCHKMNQGVAITEDLLTRLTNTRNTTEPLTPSHGSTSLLKAPNDLTESPTTGSDPQEARATVKLAVQVSARNHYVCHSKQLLGLHAMKRRHLRLKGYKIVELSYFEWSPLLKKSRTEKEVYLCSKIHDSLSSP